MLVERRLLLTASLLHSSIPELLWPGDYHCCVIEHSEVDDKISGLPQTRKQHQARAQGDFLRCKYCQGIEHAKFFPPFAEIITFRQTFPVVKHYRYQKDRFAESSFPP